MNAATAALGYLGFSRTPAGNTLPPTVATWVDQQAAKDKEPEDKEPEGKP